MVTKKARTTKKRVAKKTATRTAKKTVASKASRSPSSVADLEQMVVKSQVQLGNAYEKAASLAQTNVDRIKSRLEKAVAKQAEQREKKNALAEKASANRTPAALRQLARSRDSLRTAGQKVSELRDEIKVAKEVLKEATQGLKKFEAQQKAQAKFESDWAKSMKPKKRKVAKKRGTRKATTKQEPAVAEIPASE